MKLFYTVVVSLFFTVLITPAQAQRLKAHPLSRDDSAKLIEYERKVDQFLKASDTKTASDWLNRSARLYWDHNYFELAAKHYEQSLDLNKKLGNENGVAMINSNLGLIYHDMQQFEKAKAYLEETLAARRAKKETVGMISALINISVVLNNLKRYKESATYLEEALVLARERNDPAQMKSVYGMLSETYDKAGDSDKATHYFKLYKTFHEMVQNKQMADVKNELENQRLKAQLAEAEKRNKELELVVKDSANRSLTINLSEKELQLEYMNQKAKIKELEAEKIKEENARKLEDEKRKQRNMLFLLVLVAALLVVAYFVNRNTRKINQKLEMQNALINEKSEEILAQNEQLLQAKETIEVKTNEIKASINYASLIQSATLFHKESLAELVSDSFIFFQPKDVVSGDFYWYNQVGNKLIVSAVDCTGHGVPGGFMSMIANNLFSDAVFNKGIMEPVDILKRLDDGVREALNQHHSGNNDGMDMALCIVDYDENVLRFAGARNPMLLIQDGEVNVVKSTRRSIGGVYKAKLPDFEQTVIPMGKKNTFYLFSDGYQDQFGGKNGRKYGGKRFRQLLVDNSDLSFDDQQEKLVEELNSWKNDYRQVDDLLVIGVKAELN